MLNPNFVIVGAVIGTLGKVSYIIDTVKGKVKPNRVSFLLWSLAPLIAFFAEIKEHVGIQSLMTFSVGFLPLTIFIASFVNKKSEWKIGRFDIFCGAVSILGLILWYITQVGTIAIIFSIIADAMAGLPTIIKSYKYPETENVWAFVTDAISAGVTLLTITTWDFPHVAFPLYILIVSIIISSCIQFKFGKIKS